MLDVLKKIIKKVLTHPEFYFFNLGDYINENIMLYYSKCCTWRSYQYRRYSAFFDL